MIPDNLKRLLAAIAFVLASLPRRLSVSTAKVPLSMLCWYGTAGVASAG